MGALSTNHIMPTDHAEVPPTWSVFSRTSGTSPSFFDTIAAVMPAAPAPMMMTSTSRSQFSVAAVLMAFVLCLSVADRSIRKSVCTHGLASGRTTLA